MKRKNYTIDEKIQHHAQTPMYNNNGDIYNPYWEFGIGYDTAVLIYRNYVKMTKEERKKADELIALQKQCAKQGDQNAKGFMCGMRDAAKERKAKNKR